MDQHLPAACPGATIDYQANGSGAGIQDFINKQTAFAGSDSALKDEDQTEADARCATGPAIDIPMVGGAIVVAYNVAGVDKLILTPDVIAGIFASTITKWNDPTIAALNAGVTLPDAAIAQFHRSDDSGTTDNFTKYLSATPPTLDLRGRQGLDGAGWPGRQGLRRCRPAVKSTPNSIGYVELSFAEDHARPPRSTTAAARSRPPRERGQDASRPRPSRAPATTSRSSSTTTIKEGRRLPDRPGDLRDHLLRRASRPTSWPLSKSS